MREHIGLFRGKRTDNGEWIKGFYHYTDWVMPPTNEFVKRTHSILPLKSQDAFDVDPDTVGECTGLTDRNGKLIFEGDIVSFTRYDALGWRRDRVGQVLHHQDTASFYVLATTGDGWGWMQIESIEVIGNIHDNPELIGGTDHG